MSTGRLPAVVTRERAWMLAGVVATGVVQTTALIAMAVVTQRVLERLLEKSSDAFSTTLFIPLVGLALLGAGCRWIERVTAERLGNNYIHDVRLAMFDSLSSPQRLSRRDDATSRNHGTHVTRFSNDLMAIRQWVSLGLARIVSSGLFLGGVVVSVALIDERTAAVIAAVLSASVASVLLIGVGLEKSVRRTRKRRGRLANAVSDLIANVRHMGLYGRIPRERQRLARKSTDLSSALVDRSVWIGGLRAFTDLSHRLVMIAVLMSGSWSMLHDRLSISSLLAILGVTALIGTPLRDLGRVFEYWKGAKVARQKLGTTIGSSDERPISGQRLTPGPGQVKVRSLTFGNLFTIDKLRVRGGQRVAIMGNNGTGKSTLLQIIAGLMQPTTGSIWLDKVETASLSHSDRRSAIGIASHQVPLLTGSISKNIRYRKPGASLAEMEDACAEAGLTDRIELFPDGLRTRVGMNGGSLSDGEEARVKLARALIGRPRLLIFDEIELGLDRRGRESVLALLGNYPGTIIYATHDRQLASVADQIWCVREQRIDVDFPSIVNQGRSPNNAS